MSRGGVAASVLGAFVLVVLAACAGLPGLGNRDFWPQDEARYGTVALEMWEGAHPAVPHLNGKVYQDKPPLFFWLVNVAATARGAVDEWAARAPSVLGAALMALGAFWLLSPQAGAGTGLLAGLITLGTWNLMWESRQAHLDALFGGLIAIGMAAFSRALEKGHERATLIGYLAMGCAILVKGPLALVAVGTFAVAALVLKRPGAFFNRYVFPGIVLVLLPSAAWLGWAYVHLNSVKDGAGFAYVHALLHDQIYERAQEGYAHLQPWHFYLRELPLGLAPFAPIALFALAPATRRGLGAARPAFVVAATWLVLGVAIQSCFPGKRLLYTVPLVAPFGVLCAAVVASGARAAVTFASGWAAFVGCLVFVAAGTLAAAGIDDWVFEEGRQLADRAAERILDDDAAEAASGADSRDPARSAVGGLPAASPRARVAALDWAAIRRGGLLSGIAGLVLSAIGLTALALGAHRAGIGWTAAAIAIFVGLVCGFVLPEADPLISRKPAAEAARAAADAAGPGAQLAFMSHVDEAFPFYAGRPVPELVNQKPRTDEEKARAKALAIEFLGRKNSVLIARRSDVANLGLAAIAAGGITGPMRAGGQKFFLLRGPR